MGQRSNTLLQSKAQRSWHQTPIIPLLLFPLHPLPYRPVCGHPGRTHLRKQWAVETSQRGSMRTAPQTCVRWYRRLACHGHWPANTSRPP